MSEHNNDSKLKLIEEVGFNKYFKASSWAEYNKQFFDGLAQKYDATNELHSFGTKKNIDKSAMKRIDFPQNAKVLDLCAGSGDISIEIAKNHPDAQIVAFDASEKMLEIAKNKAKDFDNIEYKQGDALNLPYEDNTFDVAIISFGLRNLTNLEQGLKEMQRVVKPGGFVVNIDQGKPTNAVFNILYNVYFYHIAPLIGKMVFHRGEFNSFKYLPESNKYFPDQEQLIRIFVELGLENVVNYNYWVGAVAQQVGMVRVNNNETIDSNELR